MVDVDEFNTPEEAKRVLKGLIKELHQTLDKLRGIGDHPRDFTVDPLYEQIGDKLAQSLRTFSESYNRQIEKSKELENLIKSLKVRSFSLLLLVNVVISSPTPCC